MVDVPATRNTLLDPQTPFDFLLLVVVACSGVGALVLVWMHLEEWWARRKMRGTST